MHRSRAYAVIIDVPEESDAAATAFWSGVFGTPARQSAGEPQFRTLDDAIPALHTSIQTVADEGRYHIDIETDDVDAEVERLLTLGATRVSRWLNCHVLRAPGGHLLCVVPVHSDQALFDAQARTWP